MTMMCRNPKKVKEKYHIELESSNIGSNHLKSSNDKATNNKASDN